MVVTEEFICSGCNQVIKDRYIFRVDDQKLHYNCLKCCKCKCVLNGKCWYRQDKFYCKDDYDRLIQSMNSCVVCKKLIPKNTLKHTIYNINVHLNCLQCHECGKVLNSGDRFVLRKGNKFACSSHCNERITDDETRHRLTDQFGMFNNSSTDCEPIDKNIMYSIDRPASQHIYPHQHNSTSNSMNLIDYTDFTENNSLSEHLYDSNNSPIDSQPAYDHFIDHYWTQINSPLDSNENEQLFQRTKGRPRKRKANNLQVHSVDSIDALHEQDLNSSNSSSFSQVRLISSNSSHSSSSSASSSSESTTRVKRMRTSFKPYQLKMMKEYFLINKNPDSKQLLQLSLQTHLNKRTLQIFFQNHRANLRKKQKSIRHNQQLGDYLFKMIN